MNEIILYTTHCPKCRVLEKKMEQKGIKFTTCEDIDEMNNLGFTSAPMLKIDNNFMEFNKAIKWINEMEKNGY